MGSVIYFVLPPNGLRYPRVGGMRQRHFDGNSFEPRKLPENAATPTRRVHAVLGCFKPSAFSLQFEQVLYVFSRLYQQNY
jgi:hypothetical protein